MVLELALGLLWYSWKIAAAKEKNLRILSAKAYQYKAKANENDAAKNNIYQTSEILKSPM